MGTAQSEQKSRDRVRVNRTKIVGKAQRKVSRKTAMGLKEGDFMDSPGYPLQCKQAQNSGDSAK